MAEVQISPTNIIHSPTVVCKCGCKVFQEGFILKKLSPIITGGLTEELYPIPVYRCADCGRIPDEFLEKGNARAILGEYENSEENIEDVEVEDITNV